MIDFRYNLHFEPETKNVVIVLPGIKGGMDQSMIRGVFDAATSRGLAVATFDYPYFMRKEDKPSEGLHEEMRALADITEVLHDKGFRRAHLVGKSLGAVVASQSLGVNFDQGGEGDATDLTLSLRTHKLTVLGFVLNDVECSGLAGLELDVIQGAEDRFGNALEVRGLLERNEITGARIVEIAGATHSFRDAETDSLPVHEAEAIAAINWLNKK